MPCSPIESLLVQHQEEVYRHMLRVCHGSREDAEDALAEAVLSALKALDTLRSEECFCAWLKTIATRICLKLSHRTELVRAIQLSCIDDSVLIDFEQRSPAQQLEDEELRGQVKEAMLHLPEPYRSIYEKVEIEGTALDDMAHELGITYEAAKSRLRRARAMMRDHLNEIFGETCRIDSVPMAI